MSVRHVHASPGEYIAVHRDGHSYTSSSRCRRSSGGYGSGDGTGCLVLIGIVLAIFFWDELLTLLWLVIALALSAGAIWLMGMIVQKYHVQIGRGLAITFHALWKACKFTTLFVWRLISKAYGIMMAKRASCHSDAQPVALLQTPEKHSSEYGRIIQRRS